MIEDADVDDKGPLIPLAVNSLAFTFFLPRGSVASASLSTYRIRTEQNQEEWQTHVDTERYYSSIDCKGGEITFMEFCRGV